MKQMAGTTEMAVIIEQIVLNKSHLLLTITLQKHASIATIYKESIYKSNLNAKLKAWLMKD